MRLGLDFDNTLVCYDVPLRRLAAELGAPLGSQADPKTQLRDWLRAQGREEEWTRRQGHLYGVAIASAMPFPGVLEFLQECRRRQVEVSIISHRTRRPYLGPPYELHRAARAWIEQHGLAAAYGQSLPVFLEETKEAKVARIKAWGCTHFVDDLPELFALPDWPSSVGSILFDPAGRAAKLPASHAAPLQRFAEWDQLSQLLWPRSPGQAPG